MFAGESRPEEEGAEQSEDKKTIPNLVVEVYDPSTPSYKFIREITLYKNKDLKPFVKLDNSEVFLKEISFATNG